MYHLLPVLLVALLSTPATAASDVQWWNQFNLKMKPAFAGLSGLKLATEQKVTEDLSDLTVWNLQFVPSWKITDWLDLALEYKHEREKESGDWQKENRYTLIPTVHWKSGDFDWSLRTKAEYRDTESGEKWRLRERIKVSTRASLFDHALKPFVYNEFFYDLEDNEYNQNRAAAGLGFGLGDNVSLDVYYLYRSSKKNGGWSGANVLGTEWTFRF